MRTGGAASSPVAAGRSAGELVDADGIAFVPAFTGAGQVDDDTAPGRYGLIQWS
jgi:hypothetical protein